MTGVAATTFLADTDPGDPNLLKEIGRRDLDVGVVSRPFLELG